MTRRELIQIAGSTLVLGSIPAILRGAVLDNGNTRLFFGKSDLARIRLNAKSSLLSPLFKEWSQTPVTSLSATIDKFEASGDIIRDFAQIITDMSSSAVIQLIQPSRARRDSLLAAIDRILEIPNWDYFQDGPTDYIGIQRASIALEGLLFTREVLWDDFDVDFNIKFLSNIAEKGCLPCYRTVYGMDNPDTVKGWHFDEHHADFYDISMERWPTILGANNLRAAPSGALGIGALALQGHDPRAEEWLETALSSCRHVLELFAPDGSYFEGLSYCGYTLRTTLTFLEAHQRVVGGTSWGNEANFEGMTDFIVSMQAGLNKDGTPDIVNFSDARISIETGVASWIARETNSPVAQYAAENMSVPRGFHDFIWFDTKRLSSSPPPSLKNVHNDLDWVLCHSGWGPDDATIGFKSGGPANHEHADRNHFIYKIYGERLLTDLFGAAYDKRQPGWKMRMTEAHNSVLINGQGQHYHDGSEGTNDSKSYANIVQYEDHGDTVWWTSDATAAYLINNDHISKVLRTVIFAKPDIAIVIDQVKLHLGEQSIDIRFFPDNRDGEAKLTTNGNAFSIERPDATLLGESLTLSTLTTNKQKLDVPSETGDFPYIEISSPESYKHEIVTVLKARKAGSEAPNTDIQETNTGWILKSDRLNASINTNSIVPKIEII